VARPECRIVCTAGHELQCIKNSVDDDWWWPEHCSHHHLFTWITDPQLYADHY